MNIDPKTRRLLIPGLYNARDLGGMPTRSGKSTAMGRLIRSDALDQLSESDVDLLASYPVSVIIDLRSDDEAMTHADVPKNDPRFRYFNIPLMNIPADSIDDTILQDTIASSLGHLYIWLLKNSKPYFAEVLRTILREYPKPVLFHCAHGKDRTGLIAAIFYMLCGVSRENIVENYAMSYSLVAELVAPFIADTPEHVHHIFRSDASNMELLLSYVDDEYDGKIENYLLEIGLSEKEIEGLRRILLPSAI